MYLFPNSCFVEQREFTAQAPGAEFGVGGAHDIDVRTGGRAKRAPAFMLAVQPPANGGTRRHHLILAADLMLDGEFRIGEAGPPLCLIDHPVG